MDYEIIIPSHRPHLSRGAQQCIQDFNHRIFDGTNYPSFSKLINDCIVSCQSETIIICNDKFRPKSTDIEKAIDMIDEGWGLVALHRFGFFGFKKDLIRKIGFFDERYLGGGYEDCDFVRRLKEADVGYYESEEVEYMYLPTSWNYEKFTYTRDFFFKKWKHEGDLITRQMAEEIYNYDIGTTKHSKFFDFNKTILLSQSGNFKEMKMKTNIIY
jgi:hypothetical protein